MTRKDFEDYTRSMFTGLSLSEVRKEINHSIELVRNMIFEDYDPTFDFRNWQFETIQYLEKLVKEINQLIYDTNRVKNIMQYRLAKNMEE